MAKYLQSVRWEYWVIVLGVPSWLVEKFDRFRIGSHVETNKLLSSIKGLSKDGYEEFVVGQNTSL